MNTFVTFLALLGVKHTKSFSGQYFNEHPHKDNLYGLSEMLSGYRIPNAATHIDDKENDLSRIDLPFIAHAGGDFVAVYNVESDKVHYLWNGKKIAVPVSQFISIWSGVVLLAEITANSCEPDYKAHRKKDLFTIAQQSILTLACFLLLGIACITSTLGRADVNCTPKFGRN